MTSQIEQLIEDIRFNFNEDDSIILKTYIERLEQQNTALQARIKDLEEPKTCKNCKHIKFSSPLNDFVCEEGIANDISKLGSGCITMPSIFNCSLYEPKQNQ